MAATWMTGWDIIGGTLPPEDGLHDGHRYDTAACFADDMNSLLLAAAFLLALAPRAFAQTEPRPGPPIPESKGLLTRAAFSVAVARMETDDPRFSLIERGRADLDLVAYRRGRINFFIDTELVIGSERRAFDIESGEHHLRNLRVLPVCGLFDIAGVAHHVSRHVVDRELIACRPGTPSARGSADNRHAGFDDRHHGRYGYVVQHTFVDYRWTSQLTLRVDRTVARRAHVFASGRTGWVESTIPYSAARPRTAAASRVASTFPANARCSISSPLTSGVSTAIPRPGPSSWL